MNREGDARRFCEACTKQVHDLSALTEREARFVLAQESAKGRVCVRYRADHDGHIRFRRETVSAPSLWRMTMAAAGLGLTLLTGCTDAQPNEILEDRCVYEVGPWTFSARRGEGSCPAEELDHPEELMGKIAIEPPPEPPSHEVKGDIGPAPEAVPVMGEAPMIEPLPQEPQHEIELMGDVDAKAPCDPAAKGAGLRRL